MQAPSFLFLDGLRAKLPSLRAVVATALLFAFVPATTGCGATLGTVLTDVQSGVSDATLILNQIETFSTLYFLQHPNPAEQTKFVNALSDTRAALTTAEQALAGAKSASDADVVTAFADFSQAYTTLMQLASAIGVQVAPNPVKPSPAPSPAKKVVAPVVAKAAAPSSVPRATLVVPVPRIFQRFPALVPVAPVAAPAS